MDRAILRAAADLLAERGLVSLTIEGVAARAGVAKTSIYRRWSTKGTLALDAFLADFLASQPEPDTGNLESDLDTALRAWVHAALDTPTGRSLTGFIAQAQSDPELAAAWRDRVVTPLRAQHGRIIENAIARGDIPAGSDADLLVDMLYGPAYHRLLHGHLPLSDRFIHGLIAMIAAGARMGAAVEPAS